ncbi:MAG: ChuX/HutX family heme-like substrate-binding protein [Pseudomonadota bacterium]
MRPRDMADKLRISEAELVAAHLGIGSTAVRASPDCLMPWVARLGEVMALTRNVSAVHEKIGIYDNYKSGDHLAMVAAEQIDLRIFPHHWCHAYAVEKETTDGAVRRSLQIFDAAGDAVHKVILRAGSDLSAWKGLIDALADPRASPKPALAPRAPAEPAKSNPAKVDLLRSQWVQTTDTDHFMQLISKLEMNRLGAYRCVGAPFAEPLGLTGLNAALEQLAAGETPVTIIVGNRGCIQIHTGPIYRLMPMGPWQNVMDPGFNLHLRADHVAELWRVERATRRGPVVSIEAFDAEGALILQCFGHRDARGADHSAEFAEIANNLPAAQDMEAVQ